MNGVNEMGGLRSAPQAPRTPAGLRLRRGTARPAAWFAVVLAWAAIAVPVTGMGGQEATPDSAIVLYQRMLRRNPHDGRAYFRLGDAYVQKARESGDVAYLARAEKALRQALAIEPQYADAARHLAFVLYSNHDFEGAAREAQRALAINERDAHAWGVLGDARLEVGRYDDARAAYDRMLALSQDLHALGRRAGLRSVQGDMEGAVADLTRAIEEGRQAGRPRESVAWAQWQLGNEYFAVGDLARAQASHAAALAVFPGYYRATAGLAQVRAAQKRFDEAIALYQRSLAVIPLPETAAALGDLFAALDRYEEAGRQYALVEYVGRLDRVNRALYNRELALFYANHDLKVDEALALARAELEVRQDIYAFDVLAWALHKAGRHEEARTAIDAALRLGTRDARLFYHAGMIHAALARPDEARAFLRRALALNPHFDLRQAALAERTLARLEGRRP
jgi:tetratricopeptide (TPR) repeat protein